MQNSSPKDLDLTDVDPLDGLPNSDAPSISEKKPPSEPESESETDVSDSSESDDTVKPKSCIVSTKFVDASNITLHWSQSRADELW